MSKEQKDQLDRLLGEFRERVTKKNAHNQHWGENQPIRSHANRIALAWKAQLQEQVFDMVKSGTLVPSQRPWLSAKWCLSGSQMTLFVYA